MDKRQEILEKYQAFNSYLESIDLNELGKTLTRKELSEFREELHGHKSRSLTYEISELTRKMKEEEHPELLGVHHFPIIREIDFLSESQKLKLDEFLLMHRVGNYINSLWRVTGNEKDLKRLEEWLLEHEVTEEHYSVFCPHCRNGRISGIISKGEKAELDSILQEYKQTSDWELYEKIMRKLESYCMECEAEFEIDASNVDQLRYKSLTKMKMGRDMSLDNV